MKQRVCSIALALALLSTASSCSEDVELREYRGVVTFHLIPAKVIRINQISEDPEPGTSYIGDEGILVEVDENPDVMANWTVVVVRYYEYAEPKSIEYEILSEQRTIPVKYHAVSVTIDGDLSQYIQQP